MPPVGADQEKPERPPIVVYLIAWLLAAGLTALLTLAILPRRTPDSDYIAYRFAENLATGHGLQYGTPGVAVSTYPLVPALLAVIHLVLPATVQAAAGLLILLAATGATLLYHLGKRHLLAACAGLAFILVAAIVPSITLVALLVLCLLTLSFAHAGWWGRAGVLAGLAILTAPAGVLVAGLVLVWAIIGGGWRRFTVAAVLTTSAGLAPLVLAFGQPIRLVPTETLSPLWAVPALVLIISPALRKMRGIVLFAGVLALLVSLSLLSRSAPLEADSDTAKTVGEWTAANTGPAASLATYEIGALAYYANRPVIDLSARLEPVSFDRDFFFHFAPDVMVIPEGMAVPWKDITTTYDRKIVAGYAIYRRVVNFSALEDHGVDVAVGQQLGAGLGQINMRLRNVAIGRELHPGDLVRVRLDWELPFAPGYPVEVQLNLLNAQGQPVAGITDQVPASAWHPGMVSTYHLFVLPGDKVNDTLSLYLGVRVRGGDLLNILKVAEVRRAGA